MSQSIFGWDTPIETVLSLVCQNESQASKGSTDDTSADEDAFHTQLVSTATESKVAVLGGRGGGEEVGGKGKQTQSTNASEIEPITTKYTDTGVTTNGNSKNTDTATSEDSSSTTINNAKFRSMVCR